MATVRTRDVDGLVRCRIDQARRPATAPTSTATVMELAVSDKTTGQSRTPARPALTICLLVWTIGCSPSDLPTGETGESTIDNGLADNAEAGPNYYEREGTIYHYVAQITEIQRQNGQAVGDMVSYRYL